MPKPRPDECDPYYHRYIQRVPDGDILELLARQPADTAPFLARFRGPRAEHRYAPGKWSVKEVVGHMVDTDRVFGFRAFHIARGDQRPLPSMEQDEYIADNDFGRRDLDDLVAELGAVRAANLACFRSLRPDDFDRTGTATGKSFTARSLIYIAAGHVLHHREVLEQRYL